MQDALSWEYGKKQKYTKNDTHTMPVCANKETRLMLHFGLQSKEETKNRLLKEAQVYFQSEDLKPLRSELSSLATPTLIAT